MSQNLFRIIHLNTYLSIKIYKEDLHEKRWLKESVRRIRCRWQPRPELPGESYLQNQVLPDASLTQTQPRHWRPIEFETQAM